MARLMARTFVSLALLLLVPWAVGQQSAPDLILLNARVFTSDSLHPYVDALAIRGDRIVAAGTSKEIASMAGPQTKRLALGGRLVIPGINDAHYHLIAEPGGLLLQLKGQDPTWQEVTEALAAAVAKVPKGTFLRGKIGPTVLDDPRRPEATRATLDKLAPDCPVMLMAWTGHAAMRKPYADRPGRRRTYLKRSRC